MSELRDLYQEVILDHGKHPRNHRAVDDADCHAEGHNPLCGDRVTITVKLDDGKLSNALPPHLQAFYANYYDTHAHVPFYSPSSRF